jgi:copper transport protein
MARTVHAEIVLVAAVLAVAALWRFTPPPRVIAIEVAKPATVHLHGEKAMADVAVTPGRAGQVSVSAFVMTPSFDPLPAKEVTFSLSASGIEPFKRPATLVEGTWRADGLAIPFPGRWTVGVDVLISDFEMAKLQGEVEIRP